MQQSDSIHEQRIVCSLRENSSMSCFGKDCRCVRVNLSLQMQHRSVLPFCLDNHFVLSRVSSFSFTSAGCAESRRIENLLSAELSCRRTKHTSRDSSCRPWRLLPGCSMKRNRISMVRRSGLASQGGRVDIAGYSALSRAMEEGFRRFRVSRPAFGIFNRTHNHESAERITRAVL